MDEHDNLHDPNRLVRGRPTRRGSLKPETSMAIPMIMGNVPAKLGDPQIIPDCFMTEVLYAVQWIHDLNYIKLKTLENMVDKHSAKGGGSDTAIRSYVELFPTMEKLNSSQARLMMAKTYLTSEMKIAFMEFTTDDEGNKKPIKFRDEVKKVIIIIIIITMTMVSFFYYTDNKATTKFPKTAIADDFSSMAIDCGGGAPTTHTNTHLSTLAKRNGVGFPKVTLGGGFPKPPTLGCFPKPLWGVSQSYFGVFPKATLGCFPKLPWGDFIE